MRSIGPMELLAILAVAVLLFGGKRIGQFGKGLGESIREFRKSFKELEETKKEL